MSTLPKAQKLPFIHVADFDFSWSYWTQVTNCVAHAALLCPREKWPLSCPYLVTSPCLLGSAGREGRGLLLLVEFHELFDVYVGLCLFGSLRFPGPDSAPAPDGMWPLEVRSSVALLSSKTEWLAFPASGLMTAEAWLVASSIWGADVLVPTTGLGHLLLFLRPPPESLCWSPSASSHKAQSLSRIPMYTTGKGDVRSPILPFPLRMLSHPPGLGDRLQPLPATPWEQATSSEFVSHTFLDISKDLPHPKDKEWAMRILMLELAFLGSLNNSRDSHLENPTSKFFLKAQNLPSVCFPLWHTSFLL